MHLCDRNSGPVPGRRPGRVVRRPALWALSAVLLLAGCEGLELPKLGGSSAAPAAENPSPDRSIRLVERDVEAPDVFQVTDRALWDGRPSLGGVWVAYPGNVQPERVIIRNEENGKFVIGALFRRERENPGPKIQLSSDAAAALEILAGQPTMLNVTALRRESVPEVPAADERPAPGAAPITEIAAAAIDEAEGKPAEAPPQPAPAPASASPLDKPFIQIGIFSVQANADNTATSLRTQGVVPVVKAQQARGKKFWRVLIGPAQSRSERAALLKVARRLGFDDAYFVTN